MKPIALPATTLACVALIALHTAAAAPDVASDATRARATIAASLPESPAAAFDRMLAPRTPAPEPAVAGTPADALTRAFNVAVWSAQPVRQASAQVHHTAQ